MKLVDDEHERWLRERQELQEADDAYDRALDRKERFEPAPRPGLDRVVRPTDEGGER